MKTIINYIKWFFRIIKENFCYNTKENYCNLVTKSNELSVMTFNIRRDCAPDNENNWQYRKEAIVKMIEDINPDIICMQEVMPHQAKYLISKLAGCYDYDSLECFTNSKLNKTWCFLGEGLLTFYRKSIFTCISNKVIKLFDGRIINVRRALSDTLIYNGKLIRIINTHFCPYSKEACKKSFERLMLEYDKNAPTKVFIAGDFNCEITWTGNGVNIFTNVFTYNPITYEGTINSFIDSNTNTTIDYIFSNQKLLLSEVIYKNYGIKYISDHYPVLNKYEI